MPTPDDSELNQEQHERIRSRAFSRGATLRRRRTLVRRSATVAAVLAIVGGGIAASQLTEGPGHGSRPVTPASGPTGPTGPTPTTVPGTGLTGNGNTGVTGTTTPTSSSTTIPGDTTTTIPPPDTTTTVPVTTSTSTTTTVSTQTPYSNSLDDVIAPGTVNSDTWTDPAAMTLALSGFTITDLGQGTSGQVRVQVLTTGAQPETLAGEVIDELKTNTMHVSLATPLIVQPGQQLDLTAACDPDQAACEVSLDFSGTMWATASLSTPDQGGALENIAAPGTTDSADWAVPSGETFSLTDLLLDSLESAVSGSVRVDIVQSGTSTVVQNLVDTTFAALGKDYQEEQLSPAVTVPAGDSLEITVSCDADQAACQADLLYTGTSSNSNTPPVTPPTTTSTTTSIPFGG
jgi:hypothetical protein